MFDNDETKPTHFVVYTDGGCWQDLKIGGWGVHGYFFIDEPAKVGTGCKKAQVTAQGYATTGSGKPDITVTHYLDGFASIAEHATNNVAELSAAIRALTIAKESGVKNVRLLADSTYVLKGIQEWLPNWIKSNWTQPDGQPRPNKELWLQMVELLDYLKANAVTLSLAWVKGHSGDFGNEIVDKFAKLSMRAALNGRGVSEQILSPGKGYWKQAKSHSRFLNMPAWYFGVREDASDLSEDNRTIYYQGELRDSEDFNGKMISDAAFSVLYLKEADPVLETIRQESHKLAKASFYGLAVGNLNTIFKPELYEMVRDYGVRFLTYDLTKNRLETFKKELVVEERRPVRRAYYAVERLEHLEGILRSYVRKSEDGYTFTEITDLLYETVAKKNTSTLKLKSTITQSLRSMDATANYRTPAGSEGSTKIKLLVGIDLPDRNTLSAIADQNAKVIVVTWAPSDTVIRFATIVETADDIGIWSGVYSNLHLLPVQSS